MSRSLSTLAKQSLNAPETGEVFLLLLTISHASLAVPIRVANNLENVVSGGQTFVAFPFTIVLPDDKEDQAPKIHLVIDNVDRSIVQAVRTLTSPPTIQLDVALASQPDTLEASFPGFTLRQANYDQLVVEGDLTLEEIVLEPFPEGAFTPQDFPGIYGA